MISNHYFCIWSFSTFLQTTNFITSPLLLSDQDQKVICVIAFFLSSCFFLKEWLSFFISSCKKSSRTVSSMLQRSRLTSTTSHRLHHRANSLFIIALIPNSFGPYYFSFFLPLTLFLHEPICFHHSVNFRAQFSFLPSKLAIWHAD